MKERMEIMERDLKKIISEMIHWRRKPGCVPARILAFEESGEILVFRRLWYQMGLTD